VSARELITEHLDLWTGAVKKKSSSGRGSNSKVELIGIKKLREFILELAFRGKLTKQQLGDEPAQAFLERADSKSRTIVKKNSRKKQLANPTNDNQPFVIPSTWSWAKLGDIGLVASSRRVRQQDWQDHGVPFYRAREIVKLSQHGRVDNELFISENLFSQLAQNGQIPEENDLMLTGVGTIGVPYIVKQDDRFYFKDASVLVFKNISGISPQFLYYFCHSRFWKKSIHEDSMGTTVHTLTIIRANLVPIPIPPIEEQYRIVQKIDELMDLCDRLEQQTSDQLEAHETLVDTLLGTLSQSDNATELADNWARLAAHFDTLFSTEHSIDKLKQTILQLAVMGRLVEQDVRDEPVSKLLEELVQKKTRLVSSGEVRNPKKLPAVDAQEVPFAIPNSWGVIRWNDVTDWMTYGFTRPMPHVEDGPRIFTAKNVKDGYIDSTDCHKTTEASFENLNPKDMPERGDILLTKDGSIGRAAIVEEKDRFCINQSVAVLWLRSCNLDKRYLLLAIRSPWCQQMIWDAAAGAAIKHLSITNFVKFPLPVPPYNEQHRIVQKVDELIALCERLKERLTEASETRCLFAETILADTVHGSRKRAPVF
jgi:type I restriction enzyme S subunit